MRIITFNSIQDQPGRPIMLPYRYQRSPFNSIQDQPIEIDGKIITVEGDFQFYPRSTKGLIDKIGGGAGIFQFYPR